MAAQSASFPIVGILGIVFITLKLTGNIDWSWWWVLSPFWIPLALVALVLAIVGIVCLCYKAGIR